MMQTTRHMPMLGSICSPSPAVLLQSALQANVWDSEAKATALIMR